MLTIYQQFSRSLLAWYDVHGRKNLPWQLPRHPYPVWLSEIMLQQTQVNTVIPYYNRFIQAFPTINDLAQAPEDMVFALWSGLGYYTRAKNLHRTAQIICTQYHGHFPKEMALLLALPGIGPSTAAAILSQAFNQPTAILDGNVKRVLTRFFRISGHTEQALIKKNLWHFASECMDKTRCADYTQAIMDLGALCCTTKNPQCTKCPLNSNCLALQHQEQHLYPTKKIKKKIPCEQQLFLVLYNTHHLVYLEKRPPVGLWSGLWCFPALTEKQEPIEYIAQKYQLIGKNPYYLTQFVHRFSHFSLDITAVSIATTSQKNSIAESQGQWFTYEQLAHVGIAKPTRVILDKLFAQLNNSPN